MTLAIRRAPPARTPCAPTWPKSADGRRRRRARGQFLSRTGQIAIALLIAGLVAFLAFNWSLPSS